MFHKQFNQILSIKIIYILQKNEKSRENKVSGKEKLLMKIIFLPQYTASPHILRTSMTFLGRIKEIRDIKKMFG